MSETSVRTERIEMKTHTLAVMASTAWPMVLGWIGVSVFSLIAYPSAMAWSLIAIMGVVMLLVFLACIRMYLGTYLFLPPTEYQGARIVARLGRNEIVLAGLLRGEIIVKQGWMEKLFKVCHIRQQGTTVYLRGVREPEKVMAWIDGNFRAQRPEAPQKKSAKIAKNARRR